MQKAEMKVSRNQAVECGRLIASFAVVFLHIGFSDIGFLKGAVDCATRFAVPFFFVISGYYAYQVSAKSLTKRICRMIKLILIAMLVYLSWLCFLEGVINHGDVVAFLKGIFCEPNMANWVFLNINPPVGHLWYLSAATVCLAMLWVYVKFQLEEESLTCSHLSSV